MVGGVREGVQIFSMGGGAKRKRGEVQGILG